jgi:glycosyltransferase involved in cell wall biosynthesis
VDDARRANADAWAIVRCFNEAKVVRCVIEDLRRFVPNVVGVDDGSTDDSAAEMLAAGAKVVRHTTNLGPGAALQTGIEYALLDKAARYFVCFDADGQHRADDAAAMLDRLREGAVEILLGSRFLGAADGMPKTRRLVLKGARVFEWVTSGIHLTDAHNGLRAFSRVFAVQIDLSMTDMAYASELLALIKRSGLPYAEHPVTINYTDYSLSKGQRSINSINIAMEVWLHQALRGRRQ